VETKNGKASIRKVISSVVNAHFFSAAPEVFYTMQSCQQVPTFLTFFLTRALKLKVIYNIYYHRKRTMTGESTKDKLEK